MQKILSIIVLTMLLCASVFAHPGRTDSNGGHYDHSTGEYHYHHGYGPHNHSDSSCPYNTKNTVQHARVLSINVADIPDETYDEIWDEGYDSGYINGYDDGKYEGYQEGYDTCIRDKKRQQEGTTALTTIGLCIFAIIGYIIYKRS